MEIRKSRGIVLASSPCGEGDVLSSILTETHGKAKFIFKGLKKSRRRALSASEPGVVLNINYCYRDQREISTAGEFSVENSFPGVRESLGRIYGSRLMLELSDKTCGQGETDTRLFRLLTAAMSAAENSPYPVHLSAFYALHLLAHQGILPDFTSCAKCGCEITTEFSLRITDLHPLCPGCAGAADPLPREAGRFIQSALCRRFKDIDCTKYPLHAVKDLLYALISFIEDHYRIEIKSKELVLSGDSV